MKENSVFKYLTNYKTNSIIFKHFLAILLIIILPLVLLFSNLYKGYRDEAESRISDVYEQRLSNIATSFDSIYAETRLFAHSIARNPAVIDFMSEREGPELYEKADFQSIMGTSYLAYKYVESIYLYSDVNRYVLSGGPCDTIEGFRDKSWLHNFSYLQRNEIAVTPRIVNDSYPYCLSFILTVHNELGEKIGAVIVNLNIETLLQTVSAGAGDTEIYILDGYKKLLLSSNIERLFDEFNQYAYVYDRMEQTEKNGGKAITLNSQQSGLEYVSIPAAEEYPSVVVSALALAGMILLAVAAAFAVSVFLAIRTFKPIQSIMEAIGTDFSGEKELGIDNEISFIIKNINSTIQDKRLAEVELEQRIALLNNAYTAALQAQINPHFLYNTLETINFIAYRHFKAPNDISTITISLSKMLRISLDSETKIVPLSTEKEHLKLYIKIMELRYQGKCDFEFDIPHELDSCMVVKLMLQPIVENAFQHGIRPTGKKGVIRISAFANGNKLLFKIYDNGVGMDAETLRSVQKILSSDTYLSSKHIGINNVNRRIKMLLGTEYGLSVESEPGIGTTVTITLPLSYS